ncbi:THUMP domain-containing protein [Strongyloides ratti]|uniref:THUMP domain-containing protein n=1 Tax=Strongyloides ratti TaxID=34506 RepID=A0A090KXF2_STRRB|nr:THUMP domain-containing protein [Strongyloides ratti]CEF62096.1 THUMP domain-containing protein [Strongyloides ratti]
MVEPPKKRRKQTYKCNVGSNKRVEYGIFGLFFTCDGHEKQAIGEAKDLIDSAINEAGLAKCNDNDNKKNNEENDKCNDKEIDIIDALAKEINEEKDKSKKGNTLWSRQQPTGCKNSIFLTTPQIENSKDIYNICDRIVEKCQKSLNTRFLQRIEPVEITCEVNESNIEENLKNLINEHFNEDIWVDFRPTFAINFRSRNNDKIKKSWVIEIIGNYMRENFKHVKVNLNKPDLMINVSIVCRSVFLGIVQNYSNRRKLSLRPDSEAELNAKISKEKSKNESKVKEDVTV